MRARHAAKSLRAGLAAVAALAAVAQLAAVAPLAAIAALALAGTTAAPGSLAATIEGTVTLVDRGGARADPTTAIVWIDDAPGPPPAPGRASIAMRNKTFEPSVVHLPVGSVLTFPNDDPILHNVFSVSAGNRFDLGLYPRGPGREVTLGAPGIVRVFCNVHPQMEAFVVVTPGRWAARPTADGRFTIPDLPAGRYTVRVWDQRGGSGSRAVDLEADGTADVRFDLDASGYRRRPHLDKDGRPYQSAGREPY